MMKAMSHGRPVPNRPAPGPEAHHYFVCCVLAALAGAALAAQSRVNGDYGRRVHDGVVVALISFGASLVLCALLVAVQAARRRAGAVIAQMRANRLPPWFYLGGIAGAFTIFSQGTAVATLGVALFTIAVVAGQSASSLLVDRLGVGPAGRQPLSGFRLAGAALAIVAVLVSVSSQLHSPRSIGLIVLPAIVGVATAWHQAFNGRVRAASGSTLAPTSLNFLVGVAVLLPAFAIDVAVRGLPGRVPTPPWPAYLGGPLGVIFIAITVTVVRYIGVLLLTLASIAGQLVMAILLDVFAPEAGSHPGLNTFIGAALTIVAVAVALASAHRRRR
jgi:transporter family-2 protein